MPMPNILPQLDWKSIFDGAKNYDTWIGASEKEANVEVIETLR